MLDFKSVRKWSSFLAVIFVLINQTHSVFHQFTCEKKEGSSVPSIPDTYSTNIRINYPNEHRTVEVREVRNRKENKAAFEFWAEKLHLKYIQNGDQLLFINITSDERPSCKVRSKSNNEWLDTDVAGPRKIFQNVLNVLFDKSSYYVADITLENGIFLAKFEACLSNPKLNISLGFTDPAWIPSHSSALNDDTRYLATVEAEMDYVQMAAIYSNFNPVMPNDAEFQPPEDVYCEGLKSDRKVPDFPKYFSFDAEIIKYEGSLGIAPVITHRSVYYDYPAGISRTDFYDPVAEDEDIFSPVRAEVKSIVHDFNSGVQYTFNPMTGKCSLGEFKDNFAVISGKIVTDKSMPTANKYFALEGAKVVYNGQYSIRGIISNVFTSSIAVAGDDGANVQSTVSWYFSTNRTQVVENQNVEKNVLLRMVIQPQATTGKDGVVAMNFYNFAKEEPNTLKFDLTGCYNDSSRKNLVLTFPANDLLRGSEKLIRNHVHQAIKDATGISSQRIFVSKVAFSGQYMFAEFTILANPPVMEKTSKRDEVSLEIAFAKLRESVSDKSFKVRIPTKEKVVNLMPEPNGLNEFAGDRKTEQAPAEYKEGSVIALTIGMLVLGFILGGVTLNLAVSRKFGVSLFQKAKYGDNPFDNPLGESSM